MHIYHAVPRTRPYYTNTHTTLAVCAQCVVVITCSMITRIWSAIRYRTIINVKQIVSCDQKFLTSNLRLSTHLGLRYRVCL